MAGERGWGQTSAVFAPESGLLLQWLTCVSSWKSRRPLLHLTIYSADTTERGGEKAPWSQLLFASLVRGIFLCDRVVFRAFELYDLTRTSGTASCWLSAPWLRRTVLPGYAN